MQSNGKKFYIFIACMSICGSALAEKKSKDDLTIYKAFNIPLEEVSGLAVYEELTTDKYKVFAVGDRRSKIYSSSWYKTTLEGTPGEIDFTGLMLNRFSPCEDHDNAWCSSLANELNSDWEAIQVDGQGNSYILQEHSGLILIVDTLNEYAGEIRLDYRPLYKSYEAKTNLKASRRSLGEGLVLLKEGHILLAYQNDPPLIVEYGPQKNKPLGIQKSSFLSRVQPFVPPKKDEDQKRFEFEPLKYWEVAGIGECDLNEIVYDTRTDELLALSKKCSKVMALKTIRDGVSGEKLQIAKSWSLPSRIRFAEGLAVLPDGKWLIAGDYKKKTIKNTFIVERLADKTEK